MFIRVGYGNSLYAVFDYPDDHGETLKIGDCFGVIRELKNILVNQPFYVYDIKEEDHCNKIYKVPFLCLAEDLDKKIKR